MSAGGMRIAVLQRVCADYRVGLFSALGSVGNVEMRLFIGHDVPGTKVKGVGVCPGVSVTQLETRFIRLGRRILPVHVGLVDELRKFRPTVVLCEGESHFVGYLQGIYYRLRYDRRARLIHWCFIALPGGPKRRWGVAEGVKAYFRRHFGAFLVYSSFSRDRLVELGVDPRKVFVATNVGDVEKSLEQSDAITETKGEARKILGLPDRFTVLYVGTLSRNKRPDVVLDLARQCEPERYSFVALGAGDLLAELRTRVARRGLQNVRLAGKVTDQLPLYYRAADVLLMPGRGGIVISEAMAFGVPVVVHQADGTEYDLVRNGITGVVVSAGAVEDFREALEELRNDPVRCAAMGSASRQLVERRWNTGNMVCQIVRAAEYLRAASN